MARTAVKKETKEKKEPKKRKVVPKEFKVLSKSIEEVVAPTVTSSSVRERFFQADRLFRQYKENPKEELETMFLKALYDFYLSAKEPIWKYGHAEPLDIKFSKVKLDDLTNLVSCNSSMEYIKNFYERYDKESNIFWGHLIWTHLYILVEGRLKLAKGSSSYCYDLEEHLKTKKK